MLKCYKVVKAFKVLDASIMVSISMYGSTMYVLKQRLIRAQKYARIFRSLIFMGGSQYDYDGRMEYNRTCYSIVIIMLT